MGYFSDSYIRANLGTYEILKFCFGDNFLGNRGHWGQLYIRGKLWSYVILKFVLGTFLGGESETF